MFEWKWYLRDLNINKDVKVFSCFSCGGGSSMGYKRAGFNVIGNCEIDPRMNNVYVKNNRPKYNYLMDLREFNEKRDLPEELYHLDILDGSPPCSSFSLAGVRENAWGKEKVFREGQKKQVLDDLFFVFLETVRKLRPKIVVAENVVGLLQGSAKGYVNEIVNQFHAMGYDVQLFRLNSAFMNVPQSRERVFFIANNQGYKKLKLQFNGKLIKFKDVKTNNMLPITQPEIKKYINHVKRSDLSLADIKKRLRKNESGYGRNILWDDRVPMTIVSGNDYIRAEDKAMVSGDDIRNISSFPQDYDFMGQDVKYICGMSVPPNMMANIAEQIWEQWLMNET